MDLFVSGPDIVKQHLSRLSSNFRYFQHDPGFIEPASATKMIKRIRHPAAVSFVKLGNGRHLPAGQKLQCRRDHVSIFLSKPDVWQKTGYYHHKGSQRARHPLRLHWANLTPDTSLMLLTENTINPISQGHLLRRVEIWVLYPDGAENP